MPTVINAHHFAPLSPKRPPLPAPWIYIGRRHQVFGEASPLANPFTLKDHGEQALELYRRHLAGLIRTKDKATLEALQAITADTSLVCFCKKPDGSGPCHGEIVINAWNYLQSQAAQTPEPEPPAPVEPPGELAGPQEAGSGLILSLTHSPAPELEELADWTAEDDDRLMREREMQIIRQRDHELQTRFERELEESQAEAAELEEALHYQAPAGPGPIAPRLTAEAEAVALQEANRRNKADAARRASRTPEEIEAQWEINRRGLQMMREMLATKKQERLERERQKIKNYGASRPPITLEEVEAQANARKAPQTNPEQLAAQPAPDEPRKAHYEPRKTGPAPGSSPPGRR